MRDYLWALLGVLLAFVLYSLFSRFLPGMNILVNAFAVVVLYFAIRNGEMFGAGLGMLCGLLQDSFSIGIFGVAGIAFTLLGFGAGIIAKRMNVLSFSRRFLFCLVLLTVGMLVWNFLYLAIFSEHLFTAGGLLFLQPVVTALVTSALFPLLQGLDAYLIQRRQ
jgi:rod shape-determining protein MreD